MAERLTQAGEESPPLDPHAVRDSYRLHRARRRARIAHQRRHKRAGIRFWLVVVILLAGSIVLAVTMWHEVQRLFGL